MAEINSLTGAISIGRQSAINTQATKFLTALATMSGFDAEYASQDTKEEHPAPSGARSTDIKSAPERTGVKYPWELDFLARPNFLPMALSAIGFTVTSAAGAQAGTYVHTCKIAPDASMDWFSLLHTVGSGGDLISRRLLDARASKFSLDASIKEVACKLSGDALTEGDLSGTPTYTAEADYKLLATNGSISLVIGSQTLTQVRGTKFDIDQELRDDSDDRPLFTAGRTDLPRVKIGASGSNTGITATKALWNLLTRGSTTGTTGTLATPTGSMDTTFRSNANIGATTTPYSLRVQLMSLVFNEKVSIKAQNSDMVRFDTDWKMVDNVTDPIILTVTNAVASYPA